MTGSQSPVAGAAGGMPSTPAPMTPVFERASALMTLSMTLGVLQRAYRGAADKAVARLGLSLALAWPLVFIHRMGDGVRQGLLAEAMCLEGPSLVRSLDQLVEVGLVVRREDPADRRARTLHLTPQGVAMCGEIEVVLYALRVSLYEGVPDDDVAACLRVFEVLTRRLGTSVAVMPAASGPGADRAASGGEVSP